MLLGEILVQSGRVTPAQVAAALDRQRQTAPRRRIGEILVADGLISESDLLSALGRQFGCEVLLAVAPELLDPALVTALPVEWARAHGLLPIRMAGRICALTNDPVNVTALADLGLLLEQELTPVLAPRQEISRAIEECYFRKTGSARDLLKDLAEEQPRPTAPARRDDDLLRVSDQAPVTQLVNLILLEAVKARASDIHIEPYADHLQIRYRIDGWLYGQTAPPKSMEAALISRLKVMAHLDIAEKRLPQDGAARVSLGERELDIRVSTIPVAEGERVVLRLLNRESVLLPLGELGLPDGLLQRLRAILAEPHGVVLVTGPTGSGKTTTLYAALRELDTAHRNVLTIEDPIEYQLPDIGQMQVKPKIGLTFAQGLRHILRQDPDVILVGETRDLETAEILVRASLTGHLVFSTLHTNDAAGAVMRLVDMGVAPYLLASALRACLAQRLVRRLCPHCRRPAAPTPDERAALGAFAARLKDRPLWGATGCAQCLGGYRGRTGIYELINASPAIQDAVRRGCPATELRRLARGEGMQEMIVDGLEKAGRGETSLAEVLRAVGRAHEDI